MDTFKFALGQLAKHKADGRYAINKWIIRQRAIVEELGAKTPHALYWLHNSQGSFTAVDDELLPIETKDDE